MALDKKQLGFVFAACLLAALFIPTLMPSLRLMYFFPYLIIILYNRPLSQCLWAAFGCGLIVDLLSSDARFGINALNYCVTMLMICNIKHYFFADRISTLPAMTFFYSFLSTVVSVTIAQIFQHPFPLTIKWIFCDLVLMPSLDAAYAFTFFILPSLLVGKKAKRGEDYFSRSRQR